MGGYFAAVSKEDCVFDLFFGVDYHSHLGTRRAGMAVYDPETGFDKAIHNIENAPFRTKFTKESQEMHGTMGIGCISDFEAQPILVRSHHGTFAITTVGKINNADAIVDEIIGTNAHFFEMHNGEINPTELVAALIDQKENFVEGIRYAQDVIDGSMSMLLLTPKGVYAARDKLGRTPIVLGKKPDGYCASFESFAYLNLGYTDDRELGPGEIVVLTPDGVQQLVAPGKKMKICTFLWVYYGYPSSSYQGISVEKCVTTAVSCWQAETTPSRTLWLVCRTPALPTPSAMPTPPAFRFLVRLLSTRLPGLAPLCHPTRPSAT